MMTKRFQLFVCLCFLFLYSFSQERIVPVIENTVLTNYPVQKSKLKKAAMLDTISLPFFDDFSGSLSPYPRPDLWLDNFVFINDSYPVDPMSLGVATFDALNQYGRIYPNISESDSFADVLTSKPLKLSYPEGSNIFLSFYYQPQGLGDSTEVQDSLLVDFYNPVSKKWWNVWKTPGAKLHPFKAAVIPIQADTFMVNGFQFRFRNKASISENEFDYGRMGNVDHWHLDYVKLDANRSAADTIMNDVAISRPMKTLLKESETGVFLTAMPWKQFQSAYEKVMRGDIDIYYKNTSADTVFVKNRSFYVKDLKGTNVTSFLYGGENIFPQKELNFKTYLEYPFFTDQTDSALFEVKGVIDVEDYPIKINDTTRFIQEFSNYFAYDDGIPEDGYGLSGQGTSNGMVAYKFKSYYADSLSAVRIFFNGTIQDTSLSFPFKIMVWKATPNGPGSPIYTSSTLFPTNLGKYTEYKLDSSLIVNGEFFIGWSQPDENFRNVGLDLNNSATGKLYYNIGAWKKSAFDNYALMIRPVFGSAGLTTDIPVEEEDLIKIYPNPASENLNIEFNLDKQEKITATLVNMTGKIVYQKILTERTINLSDLPTGVYFLILAENGKRIIHKEKIIVQH